MSRPLRIVADGNVLPALREALAGGPAVLPRPRASIDLGGSAAIDHVDAALAPPSDVPAMVDDPVALVVETSGSTGDSKRVALSARALLASASAADARIGGPGQWLLCLPEHYIAGVNVLARSIVAGTEPVRMEGTHFDVDRFMVAAAALEHERRYVSLVPVQLARLLDDERAHESLAAFEAVLVGGQATPARLVDRAHALGIRLVRTYGASETSGGCIYDGRPLDGVDVRAVDGELWISGPTLAEGYLDDSALTADRFIGGWYRTGDTGDVVDGIVRVTGRLDDVIISGGLKVSLGAVERVVRSLPGLETAVVVRAAHAEWGEVPVVIAERESSLAEVRAAVEAVEGPAGRPHRLVVVERMPLLPSGKPDRREAQRLAAGESS
ncbi:AMP-binding protein [Ruicaihuangia caeni]|uniref:AMP-binding protein n=1 Tax=Ruicaihuangia caeni TaxID=3042517 RepID=A0AAW6T4Z2_9MICO|nr:AMP-binding protein [Klugiella sp. YN-L-19]MDI2098901.1 AMP-binding protein [Klugiella sp. YN-L-19]